jgi:hypothetical protein
LAGHVARMVKIGMYIDYWERGMASSGMLRRVALLRTDVSEELSKSLIRATRIGELRITRPVTSNRCTLLRSTK